MLGQSRAHHARIVVAVGRALFVMLIVTFLEHTPAFADLLSPKNSTEKNPVTFRWTAKGSESHFLLRVLRQSKAVDAARITTSALGCSNGGTCELSRNNLPDGQLEWQVKSFVNSKAGDWGPKAAFKIDNAGSGSGNQGGGSGGSSQNSGTLISPIDTTESNPVDFRWNNTEKADEFFWRIMKNDKVVDATKKQARAFGCENNGTCKFTPGGLANGDYDWHVKPYSNGKPLGWSETESFRVGNNNGSSRDTSNNRGGQCRPLKEPTKGHGCYNSPTHKYLKSQCIANRYANLSNASPCSKRYKQKWRMSFDKSYVGMPVNKAFERRYGKLVTWNSIYKGHLVDQPSIEKSFTVEKVPGGAIGLRRNIKPGVVPSQNAHFNNFSKGTKSICISLEIYVPKNFVGSKESGKLGYGVWGGKPDTQPGGGVSPTLQKAWTIRNTRSADFEGTKLYGYHQNRGNAGLWTYKPDPEDWVNGHGDRVFDNKGCGIHADSSRSGTIKKGSWVKIEQEVVANTSKKANGLARLWIDGNQVAEMTGLSFGNMPIKGLKINDMWGGDIFAEKNQARKTEHYYYRNHTVYGPR